MAGPRIQFRCSDTEYVAYEQAAAEDERNVNEWAKRILDIAANSGMRVADIRDALVLAAVQGKSRRTMPGKQ